MDAVRLAIDADNPLLVGEAIKKDKLNRLDFARSVIKSLESIDSLNGFAVSVEGAWGSGKTSTLAMVEELLNQDGGKAIVVHFNPWLVGDRDALLRQFLDTVATTVSETSLVTIGGKIARVFRNYNALFDAAKYIPGLEPWITITQSIASSVGKIAESGYGNLEYQKKEVEKALRELEIPIIVFIDDIDRLFPQEVYEMIRIIKAVGDLPNVGYVLAWDAKYIQDALESASVPMAGTYLDKIVQIRLSLPQLSFAVKSALFDEALARLPKEAQRTYFPNNQGRMAWLFHYGLGDMLEQPRDIVRLFNTVMLIEPVLRGEIELADIVGFAALMLKAPAVFGTSQNGFQEGVRSVYPLKKKRILSRKARNIVKRPAMPVTDRMLSGVWSIFFFRRWMVSTVDTVSGKRKNWTDISVRHQDCISRSRCISVQMMSA